MKKIIFILIIISSWYSVLGNCPYTFTLITEDYVDLVNSTSINDGQIWDQNSAFHVDFDFDFNINGIAYNSLRVKAGGIEFIGYGNIYMHIFSVPCCGYLLKDRGTNESESPITFVEEGEEGSRILKIQWKNAGFVQEFSSSSENDYVNYQIWLYEEDNSVKIHYGESVTSTGTYSPPEVTPTGPTTTFKCSSDSLISFNGVANNPSMHWVDLNTWYYSIDGTPSENTVYHLTPNSDVPSENVWQYTFSKTTRNYEPLSNPVELGNYGTWVENQSYVVDFNFTVNGDSYSNLNVHSGGGISFPSEQNRGLFVYHTVYGGYQLQLTEDLESTIGYEMSGEEGDRILKLEWKNAGFKQWYPTSELTDLVNFQIWLYQKDSHVEIYFGENITDTGTYGYPDATSDDNPGPGIRFLYDDCSNVLSVIYSADVPSWDYYDFCSPNQSFVDGTPSLGTVYMFHSDGTTSIENNLKSRTTCIYPNPALSVLNIENSELINEIWIIDITGKVVYKNDCVNNEQISIDINHLLSGIYSVIIMDSNKKEIHKLIK